MEEVEMRRNNKDKDLVIVLKRKLAMKYSSEDTVVVYPTTNEGLSILKLFLKVNRLARNLKNILMWSRDGAGVKDHLLEIQQKINEVFDLVRKIENEIKKGGKK